MRIRQIKPGWWLDKDLRTRLTADEREFYVGLWMIADDDGYFVWDVSRIAAELYPYDVVRHREGRVTTWAQRLVVLCPDDPHLILLPCGHARVPKLADHQRSGGRPVYTVRDLHRTECARAAQNSLVGRVGYGRERNGRVVTPDGTNDAPSEFTEKMTALGVQPPKAVRS